MVYEANRPTETVSAGQPQQQTYLQDQNDPFLPQFQYQQPEAYQNPHYQQAQYVAPEPSCYEDYQVDEKKGYAIKNVSDVESQPLLQFSNINSQPQQQYMTEPSFVVVEHHYLYSAGLPVGHTPKNRLIARVMAVVSMMLGLTALIAAPVYQSESATNWLREQDNWWVYLVGWICAIVFMILAIFVRHKAPWNIFCLLGITVSFAVSISATLVYFDAPVIIEAAAITVFVVLTILLLVLVAKTDLRLLAAFFIVVLTIMLWWSLWCFLLFPVWYSPYGSYYWVQSYCLIAVLLFACYLMFDISRLREAHCEDEWVLASINIYVDIIYFFLYLLLLLGGSKK